MKTKLVLVFLFISITSVYSQGEIDDQGKIFYRNEKSLGLLLNSNGYGLSGRYGKQINARNKRIYNIDLAVIKHPKEFKTSSAGYYGKSFIYGKLNTFFTIRGGTGRQHEIYKKIDKGGIAIRYFYNYGPSFGFFKPIYYDIVDMNSPPSNPATYPAKFDPSGEQYIYGKYSFFKGIDEIQFNPGAYAKIGFSFEYSNVDQIIHAIEAGCILDAFLGGVPLMANNKESHLYPCLFVSYRFGKIVDAQLSSKKRKEMEKEKKIEE